MKSSKTLTDAERIKALEVRLDAAVNENRRLRADFDALMRDPLQAYRRTLQRRHRGRSPMTADEFQRSSDPHEDIN